MKNKTLIIGATHGDELIGVEVLRSLEKKRLDFDWVIGNPKAFEQGTREFEGDLNRSAPGNMEGESFEERRAAELVELSKSYEYVVDLHGSPREVGSFIIIGKPSEAKWKLASLFNIKRIVMWPPFTPELEGPLSDAMKSAIEIESGPKTDPEVRQNLEKHLEDFLQNLSKREARDWKTELKTREIFEVYGTLKEEPPKGIQLKEFTEVTINDEIFFPLLIDSYRNSGIVCYKMRRRYTYPFKIIPY